jgi:hypothetical protein
MTKTQDVPTAEWFEGLGFTCRQKLMPIGCSMTICHIVLDDYDGEIGDARIELRFVNHDLDRCFWMPELESFNEDNRRESYIGLTKSWCKTKEDVLDLCLALGVELGLE